MVSSQRLLFLSSSTVNWLPSFQL
uniref:Uncharacterized protein n=1 Tax=Rhizophora mucronata TaxID=61149 RepID=A0A2P2QF73_RHIMU